MTTGSASSFPLTRLAAAYNRMRSDGRVLSNRASLDLLDHRLMQLAERVDANEAPERVAKLHDVWLEYKIAKENGFATEAALKMKELDALFDATFHDYMAWKQIFEGMDLRRKLSESEVKVLKEIKSILTAEDAVNLTAKLFAALMRVEDDPKKLKQVQYEFSRITGFSSDKVGEGTGEDDWGGGREEDDQSGSGEMDRAELLHPGDEGRPETAG